MLLTEYLRPSINLLALYYETNRTFISPVLYQIGLDGYYWHVVLDIRIMG
jgi:hypothetical protein